MSITPQTAVLRLSRDLPNAERKIDEALIATTAILQTVIDARSVVGVPAREVQQTLLRLTKVQNALLEASGDLFRSHGDLSRFHQEYMGADEPYCPPASGELIQEVAA